MAEIRINVKAPTYAKNYIDDLNAASFEGFSDWRLPSISEALSLLTPNQNKDGLFIDQIF